MALATISPVDKKYKPSKLENFAKMMDIAASLGSMAGSVGKVMGPSGPPPISSYLETPKLGQSLERPSLTGIGGGKLTLRGTPSLMSPLEIYRKLNLGG